MAAMAKVDVAAETAMGAVAKLLGVPYSATGSHEPVPTGNACSAEQGSEAGAGSAPGQHYEDYTKCTLTLPDGRAVQVKYRGKRGWDLATDYTDKLHKELRADIYVLVWPGEAEGVYTLVGYCTQDDWKERIVSPRPPIFLRGYRYEIRWPDLRPISELMSGMATE